MDKKDDNEIRELLNLAVNNIGDPYGASRFTDYYGLNYASFGIDDDPRYEEVYSTENMKSEIDRWYNITQSVMKILFTLKNEQKLDVNQRRTFNRAMKAFGWENCKKVEDITFRNIDEESPYIQLSEMSEIITCAIRDFRKQRQRNGLDIRKEQKEYLNSIDDEKKLEYMRLKVQEFDQLATVMDDLRAYSKEEQDGRITGQEERIYLDDSREVGELYKATKHNELQALADIHQVSVLTQRFTQLAEECDNHPYLRDFHSIVEEIIYKSISLGYSAGINANTTAALRRMKEDNKSDGENNKK